MKWLIKQIKNHKYATTLTLTTLLPIIIGLILKHKYDYFKLEADLINYYGFSLTILAITIAIIQATRNQDWNRRVTAMNHLSEIREKLKEHTPTINEHFKYNERGENDAITVDQIHSKICLKNSDGYAQDPTTKKLKLNQDDIAKKIRSSIIELLNTYEGLAAGIYQGIYDREVVAELMASNIIKASNVFSLYIDHLNDEMYQERNKQTWINFKTLGAEFKEEFREKKKANQRKNA